MLNYKKYNPPPVSLCYAFTFLNAVLLTLIGISATYGGQKKTALSHGDNSLITSGLQLRRDLQSQYLLKERQSDEGANPSKFETFSNARQDLGQQRGPGSDENEESSSVGESLRELDSLPWCIKGEPEMSMQDTSVGKPMWTGLPAKCTVRGLLIEELRPEQNFRAGFHYNFTHDVEDKTHVLPWFLAARKNLQRARRKVFLDLGGKTFSSSTQWFMQMYPLVFDDIHAFEVRKGVYRIPKGGDGLHDSKSPTLVQDALDKVTLHEGVYVSHKDLRSALNITRWMIEDLKLQPEDAVIVKMDIEEAEWPILHYWAENPQMGELVDELFVEIHYKHESMFEYGWPWTSSNHTREEATSLLHNLRANGIYAHAWP
eukprot:jgi/Mesen1/1877/ME000143S00925